MKQLLLSAALLVAGTIGMESSSWAHGRTYRGPGDTVPPGGSGLGGGGGPGSGRGGPGNPGGPGSGGSATGGPGRPGGFGGVPGSGAGPAGLGPDLSLWSFWWEFNKDPFLNLKSALHGNIVRTGSSGYFLGQGQDELTKDSLRPTDLQIRQTVIPALLSALETESNNDIITGCMIALAKIGDVRTEEGQSAFEEVIASFLSDSNQEISESAAIALGILADPSSVETLQHLVEDDATGRKLVGRNKVSDRTRTFATYGLGLIGAGAELGTRQQVVQILVDTIAKDDTKSRDLGVACIVSMGLVPLEIGAPTGNGVLPAAGKATAPAPLIGIDAQLDYLLTFLADDDNNFLVRAHVPTALARLLENIRTHESRGGQLLETQKKRVADQLLSLFDGKRSEAREIIMGAILAMGLIGDADDDPIDARIRGALAAVPKKHSDVQARNFSLIAMGQVGARRGSGQGVEDGVREAGEYLLHQLAKGKSSIRPWAGLSIGVMGRALGQNSVNPFGMELLPDMQAALRSRLKSSKNPQNVGAFAIATGLIGDREAHGLLMEKLSDLRDDEARGYLALALGLGRVSGAQEQIQKIVKESKYRPELLRQAAVALGLLGDNSLVDELIAMLEEATNLATQAAISSALGFIGDSRSITPLVEMLADESMTPSARGFAAVSLGIVADKEAYPWNSKLAVDLNYRASTATLTDQSSGTGIIDIK